ncbi:MAG: CvpA family protein [Spirochaetales bacterium]|uniref:CvpA family protein n=1 Tax=Candidatus Thalassospirochaeta sargassi TaxID=3119039 RepID=A0AAJ1ILQ9_9SPIO|nr:CvpA family protein [Spirochaetales bacterium]
MQFGDFTIIPIDIFFTAIILFMTIKAIIRGFVTEVMSIAAIGLGIILGVLFSALLGDFISSKFGESNWNQVIAFLIIFLVSYIVIKIFENGLNALVDKIHLDRLDRSLGLFFGILEGIVLVMIIVFVIEVQPLINTDKVESESWYIQMIHRFVPDGETVLDEAIDV